MPAKPPTPVADPRVEEVASVDSPEVGSSAPIKPNTVKTLLVRPGKAQMAALSELPPADRTLMPPRAHTATVSTIATVKSDLPPQPVDAEPGVLGTLPAKPAAARQQVASVSAAIPVPAPSPVQDTVGSSKPRSGWMIQVGAFPEETAAKERLEAAQSKAKAQLVHAEPFTEKVARGDKSLFRARFAGLEKNQAEAACKNLKRSEIPCLLMKN
jgi:D-alanyl-D-alanine carboxypeptidase